MDQKCQLWVVLCTHRIKDNLYKWYKVCKTKLRKYQWITCSLKWFLENILIKCVCPNDMYFTQRTLKHNTCNLSILLIGRNLIKSVRLYHLQSVISESTRKHLGMKYKTTKVWIFSLFLGLKSRNVYNIKLL